MAIKIQQPQLASPEAIRDYYKSVADAEIRKAEAKAREQEALGRSISQGVNTASSAFYNAASRKYYVDNIYGRRRSRKGTLGLTRTEQSDFEKSYGSATKKWESSPFVSGEAVGPPSIQKPDPENFLPDSYKARRQLIQQRIQEQQVGEMRKQALDQHRGDLTKLARQKESPLDPMTRKRVMELESSRRAILTDSSLTPQDVAMAIEQNNSDWSRTEIPDIPKPPTAAERASQAIVLAADVPSLSTLDPKTPIVFDSRGVPRVMSGWDQPTQDNKAEQDAAKKREKDRGEWLKVYQSELVTTRQTMLEAPNASETLSPAEENQAAEFAARRTDEMISSSHNAMSQRENAASQSQQMNSMKADYQDNPQQFISIYGMLLNDYSQNGGLPSDQLQQMNTMEGTIRATIADLRQSVGIAQQSGRPDTDKENELKQLLTIMLGR